MSLITGICQRTETKEIDTVFLLVREDYQKKYPAHVVTSLGSSDIQKLPRITLPKQYYSYLRCETILHYMGNKYVKLSRQLVCM
jgi:hypothetical protein